MKKPCISSKIKCLLDPAWFALLGLLGFLEHLHPKLEPLSLLYLFFLVPIIALLFREYRSSKSKTKLPLPGPAVEKGTTWFYLQYFVSSSLSLLNPRQMLQIVFQVVGQAVAVLRAGGEVPNTETYRQKVRYTLPFRSEWFVYNGGVTPETTHSWSIVVQRYAYDFVIVDKRGQRHGANGRKKEDYFAYRQPILAPADGVVVRVREVVRDAPRVGTGWVDWKCSDFRGNFVVIRHAADEYSFLAHLIPGSIQVHPGDHVLRGHEIGRCGDSGHSTEPHLHFHIQDRPNFFQHPVCPLFSETPQRKLRHTLSRLSQEDI